MNTEVMPIPCPTCRNNLVVAIDYNWQLYAACLTCHNAVMTESLIEDLLSRAIELMREKRGHGLN